MRPSGGVGVLNHSVRVEVSAGGYTNVVSMWCRSGLVMRSEVQVGLLPRRALILVGMAGEASKVAARWATAGRHPHEIGVMAERSS